MNVFSEVPMLTAAQLMARAQLCRVRAQAAQSAARRANLLAFALKFEELAQRARVVEAARSNELKSAS